MTKQKKVWTTDPEGLKRANPSQLTDAENAYRQLLLRQDAERMSRKIGVMGDARYLQELGEMIAQQGKAALPPQPETPPETPPAKDAFDE